MQLSAKKAIPATLIPGDGIGPEIVEATVTVLEALGAPFEWEVQKPDVRIGGVRRPAAPNHSGQHPTHSPGPKRAADHAGRR